MMNNPHPIRDYLIPGKRVHLVGIGGVSMCPLAEVLRRMGMDVQGSDMTESKTVLHLRELGIPVVIGHLPGTVAQVGAQCVIRTAAVHDDNPEIAAALAAAKADEKVAPLLEGMQIVKELYVPGKLVNLVVKPQ